MHKNNMSPDKSSLENVFSMLKKIKSINNLSKCSSNLLSVISGMVNCGGKLSIINSYFFSLHEGVLSLYIAFVHALQM